MGDNQVFTDSHAKLILTTMNNLRKSSMLCDITLKVDGACLPAHRVVLASCSDYFKAMFTNEMSEKDKSVIEFHGISGAIMEALLEFVYTESVIVTVENVQELLPAACLLQLAGVKEACSKFLERQLDATNCLGIKIFAENHCCKELYTAADSFTLQHFEEIVEQEEFKNLSIDDLEAIMKSDEIQVNSEEPLYDAVISWVTHDKLARQDKLSQLLQHVRLPLLSAKHLTDVIDNEPLVKRCHACRDLVDEAKRFHLRPDLRQEMTGIRMRPRSGPNDVLVVLGGFGSNQNLVDTVECFDPKTETWSELPSLSRKTRYVAAAAINSKLFVIGGYNGQSRLDSVECLDMAEESPAWHNVSPMQQRRGLAGVCVYRDAIYVCGGFDGFSRHTSMERYSPASDTWTLLSGMQVGREGAGLVLANDMFYCIGGYDGVTLLKSAERYDPINELWSAITPMSTQRSGAGTTVVNDMIYVCGGYDGTNYLSSVETYNVHTTTWTSIQHMIIPRCYVGACVLRGKILVVAGYDGSALLNTVECYDPLLGRWEVFDDRMLTHRCDAGVIVIQKV